MESEKLQLQAYHLRHRTLSRKEHEQALETNRKYNNIITRLSKDTPKLLEYLNEIRQFYEKVWSKIPESKTPLYLAYHIGGSGSTVPDNECRYFDLPGELSFVANMERLYEKYMPRNVALEDLPHTGDGTF